ncbi:uncharacterized protein LOC113294100 [Papaver somniferum]|uniref:uncharacterized protein LOC113294100 n=1 Tax=Papaver somniferum TaxID=3469 RepID=UPI000E6FFF38|nr:uncharacterized protein LOC113294100 [Papaver somniferum]
MVTEKSGVQPHFQIGWPNLSQAITLTNKKSEREKFSRAEKGKNISLAPNLNVNLNKNLNSNFLPQRLSKRVNFGDKGASTSNVGSSPINSGSDSASVGDSDRVDNDLTRKEVDSQTTIIFQIESEDDVEEHLKQAVSIPYLQKLDASLENVSIDSQSTDTSPKETLFGKDFLSSTEKWSIIKHRVEPDLRNQFDSILVQMKCEMAVVEEFCVCGMRLRLPNSDFEWLFSGIYAPSNYLTRPYFWREIEEVRAYWNFPWVIGGDWNVIRYIHERTSCVESNNAMRKFNRFISRHELLDFPMIGATFTWTNNQVQSIRSRIYRFLLSPIWEINFPNVVQQALARPCSDHSPLALICNGVKGGPGPFGCEKFWYAHPDFLTFISNAWTSFTVSGSAGFIMCKKLQLLKPLLKSWAKHEFGDMDRRLEELEEVFMQLDEEEDLHNGITDVQRETRLKARKDYCNIKIAKGEKWRSRARVNHITNNENNTNYFHKLASDRRRRNFIGAIKVNGFSSISEDLKNWLELYVGEDECINAIKLLGKNQAPGPDGFAISFYLRCWEILKEDFMNIFQELQHRSFLYWRLKNTFISLIPKKYTIEEIKYLRPINLVHGVYKIVSKVLAERFKTALPSVIYAEQTAFIKKRKILDGVLVANELIDSRTRSGKPDLLIKVDFEKAFDHMNWDFIDEIFGKMGFGDKWRSWVSCCVELVRFSVIINGLATGYFKSSKGIRQGDPLSPFLFLLVGEALSFMIKQAQEHGLISGFQVAGRGRLISHLQFADDTLIFLDADVEQIKQLRLLLISFEMLTGLKINFAKSQIFGVCYDGDMNHFADLLGCYTGMLPTTYVGLPLGDKCKGVAKLDKVIDKVIFRLPGWKSYCCQEQEKLL